MSQIQASIGVEQMKRLPGFVEARLENFNFLAAVFSNFGGWFEPTLAYDNSTMSPFGYVVKLSDNAPFRKEEFERYLDSMGIRSRAFFCGNITKQPVLVKSGRHPHIKHADLSVSDDIMNNSFWIGVHPKIKEEQRNYMEEKIVTFLQRYK